MAYIVEEKEIPYRGSVIVKRVIRKRFWNARLRGGAGWSTHDVTKWHVYHDAHWLETTHYLREAKRVVDTMKIKGYAPGEGLEVSE